MLPNDYPPPKYETIIGNDDGKSHSSPPPPTRSSPAPPVPSPQAQTISETNSLTAPNATAAPFRINLISTPAPVYRDNPIETDCPYCQAHIVTSVERVIGTLPWIIMALCFLPGFFLLIPWCICCIPFCIDNYKDAIHSCPLCKRIIGRYEKG